MNLLTTTPVDVYHYLDSLFKGESWVGWEPETVFHTVNTGKELDPLIKDKIGAVIGCAGNPALVTTNSRAFEKVVHAFCNNPCVIDAVQPPQVEEVFWAVDQIIKIICTINEGMISTDVEFSGEIPGYVAGVSKYNGWVVLPTRLSFAREMLDNINNVSGWDTAENIPVYKLLQKAHSIADALDSTTVDTKGLDSLEEDTPENNIIRKLVGCTLYKPY